MGIPHALFNVVAYRNGYRYYPYTKQTYSQRLLAVGADALIPARKNPAFSSPLPSSPSLAQERVRPVHRLLRPALRSGCVSTGEGFTKDSFRRRWRWAASPDEERESMAIFAQQALEARTVNRALHDWLDQARATSRAYRPHHVTVLASPSPPRGHRLHRPLPHILSIHVAAPGGTDKEGLLRLSFAADSELYDWHDDIYSRAPQLGGASSPHLPQTIPLPSLTRIAPDAKRTTPPARIHPQSHHRLAAAAVAIVSMPYL
ncbi:hypothetical protein BJ912DRAFT_1064702 [Pholiota molesta]|nr:hypothetical protein BJ912DRAFT_1064702 [Pholiota molesta]